MAECTAGCGTPLHPALTAAGIPIHPVCEHPDAAAPAAGPGRPRARLRAVPDPERPRPAGEPCKFAPWTGCNAAAYTFGHGAYCRRHARMMAPARDWARLGVPTPEQEQAGPA
jgi:hypothetical protein